MSNSALGFHTFSISKRLTLKEAKRLFNDFHNYQNVSIIPEKILKPSKNTNGSGIQLDYMRPSYLNIVYPHQKKGIKWCLSCSPVLPHYLCYDKRYENKTCSIQATINPKIFTGINDYITAANETCLNDVATAFNQEAKRISPILGECSSYQFNRIDYCVNFDLKELNMKCSPQRMMELIKRGDIPANYKLYTDYSQTSHRNIPKEYSFYLVSKSATINIYWKWYQLQKKFPDCSDMDNALNVIRFEVQYKYPKIHNMSKQMFCGFSPYMNSTRQGILSKETAENVISNYFRKVIHSGIYYTLQKARNIIESRGFHNNKEKRLISTLTLINRCRGIAKAKETLKEDQLVDFRRSLRELDNLGINPVTIPKEWNIKYVPNLFFERERRVGKEIFYEKMIYKTSGK